VTGLAAGLTHTEEVMGTVVSFTVAPGGLPAAAAPTAPTAAAAATAHAAAAAHAAIDAACQGLHRADAVFSTWIAGSPVSRLRRGEVTLAELPPGVAAEVSEVLELCRRARAASRGWFDPWAMPGGLDPAGLVKGWAVQRAADSLRRAGLAAALVNGGGDLAAFGSPAPGQPAQAGEPGAPWRVGIRHPWRADALACVVSVRAAIATSASYERGAHLIDPASGRPVTAAASATVTGPSLAMADALATALAVGGDDALAAIGEVPGYEGYLIRADGSEVDTGGMEFVD
jgi:FAD:protein FMN transferase